MNSTAPPAIKKIASGIIALVAAFTLTARSQTLNWGSEVFSDLRDSNGITLDDLFVFEVGAFKTGFAPDESNVDDWLSNWYVFDRAGYNRDEGYFTATTQMQDNGTSTSPWLTPGASSFVGMEAYLWIRKGTQPVPGSEWLVVHATTWNFPTAIPGCCDNGLPVEWSVSDLSIEIPKWGNQGGVPGPGENTDPGPYDLQTYTFIPEPSAALLAVLGGGFALLRRRRQRDGLGS